MLKEYFKKLKKLFKKEKETWFERYYSYDDMDMKIWIDGEYKPEIDNLDINIDQENHVFGYLNIIIFDAKSPVACDGINHKLFIQFITPGSPICQYLCDVQFLNKNMNVNNRMLIFERVYFEGTLEKQGIGSK